MTAVGSWSAALKTDGTHFIAADVFWRRTIYAAINAEGCGGGGGGGGLGGGGVHNLVGL